MMKKTSILLTFLIFLSSSNYSKACSTFMIKNESQHILGHNLDISGNMPGMVFINKRGVLKRGQTWEQLSSTDTDITSNISWVSRFGSVSFNAFGRELPDGGMNEEGLFVWEMSGISTFDKEESRPRLFMSQWIQYQLDNFKSVEEVLDHLPAIGLDGWNWHFFISDKKGETAAIEFIDGHVIVNTKNNMPVPIMGNGRYADDLSFLKEFEGFGGEIEIDHADQNLPGFVKAAKMMTEPERVGKVEDTGFAILETISGKISKWAIIFDVQSMTAYFRTAQNPEIKSFSILSFDFSANTAVMTLNIQDADLHGDVSNEFVVFKDKDNYQLARETAAKLYDDDFEISQDTLAYRLANVYKTHGMNVISQFDGTWSGHAEYPTTGEPARVDWTCELWSSDGKMQGRITDSAGLLADTEMRNIIFNAGIFQFTVYSYGYVFKIYGKVSGNAIEGIFDISDESRKGKFLIQSGG